MARVTDRVGVIFDSLALGSALGGLGLLVFWKTGVLAWGRQELETGLSNLVALYCMFHGCALWVSDRNRTLASGLMMMGILILAANLVTGGV